MENIRKMKVSGARSASGKFRVLGSRNIENIRKMKHFRRAKHAGNVLGFGDPKPWKT